MQVEDKTARMKISEVVDYLKVEHGITVTKRTVYNWVETGVRGIQLEAMAVGGWSYTTGELVDQFLQEVHEKRHGPTVRPQEELDEESAAARKQLQEAGWASPDPED